MKEKGDVEGRQKMGEIGGRWGMSIGKGGSRRENG
jgi:hypothetical protein